MTTPPGETVAVLRRGLAYWWYALAQSACHWGLRTLEPELFRMGVGMYSRALRAWPEFAHAYYWRGRIRGRELHEHQAAIADLTSAIDLDPEWPEPYLQRGLIQRFHGDPHAALSDLEAFLARGGEVYWRIEAERQITMLRAELAEIEPSQN